MFVYWALEIANPLSHEKGKMYSTLFSLQSVGIIRLVSCLTHYHQDYYLTLYLFSREMRTKGGSFMADVLIEFTLIIEAWLQIGILG